MDANTTTTKKPMAFATLPKEKLKLIAQKGGVSCQSSGKGRRWDAASASLAGKRWSHLR